MEPSRKIDSGGKYSKDETEQIVTGTSLNGTGTERKRGKERRGRDR